MPINVPIGGVGKFKFHHSDPQKVAYSLAWKCIISVTNHETSGGSSWEQTQYNKEKNQPAPGQEIESKSHKSTQCKLAIW